MARQSVQICLLAVRQLGLHQHAAGAAEPGASRQSGSCDEELEPTQSYMALCKVSVIEDAPAPRMTWCCVSLLQVGSLIIFLEYERTRKKEIAKQQKDAAERQGIIERARLEREVRTSGTTACHHMTVHLSCRHDSAA